MRRAIKVSKKDQLSHLRLLLVSHGAENSPGLVSDLREFVDWTSMIYETESRETELRRDQMHSLHQLLKSLDEVIRLTYIDANWERIAYCNPQSDGHPEPLSLLRPFREMIVRAHDGHINNRKRNKTDTSESKAGRDGARMAIGAIASFWCEKTGNPFKQTKSMRENGKTGKAVPAFAYAVFNLIDPRLPEARISKVISEYVAELRATKLQPNLPNLRR